ncbi:TetR/AcrR family transcriptional regulator [Amycolatopsis sp.]|uniref:TetR/AcrR family transcriptional regulator n=1 Tax=Amycolatopsis sp. TaxID=37632 RepID=UPI00262ED056|nr:TetR/AcrR family transcriptional regulator [Amycolatopsis sp.]
MDNAAVSTEYTGGGDPQRSIELLWGVHERPRRGPKPKLTIDMIVSAAIRLADAEGLPALSMRRVADHLGVAAMSLYTYVPSKAELIDLMMDTVHGELGRPGQDADGWRPKLEAIAHANWRLYHRHAWMLQVTTNRPPLGPHTMIKYEHELGAVDGAGLTDLEMDAVISLLAGYVQGAARNAVDAAQLEQRTGMTDEQWWTASAPVLEKIVDASHFPLSGRVGTAAGEEYGSAFDAARNFEFGLPLVLDGVERLIASRS